MLWGGAVAGAGCDRSGTWDDPGPEATFRTFLMHWFKNERREAFQMIDPEDRERLADPLEELRDELEESKLPKPEEMLVAGRVDNPYDIKSIGTEPELESKPETGKRVVLELSYQDGRSGAATMVWRGDQWYVDLPEAETEERRAGTEKGSSKNEKRSGGGERRDGGNRGNPDGESGERRD